MKEHRFFHGKRVDMQSTISDKGWKPKKGIIQMSRVKRLKNRIRLVLYVSLPVFLSGMLSAGCGREITQNTGISAESKMTAGPAERENHQQVTMMCPIYSAQILEDYWEKKNPESSLQVQTYPEEQYYTILKTQLATGKAADILDIQQGYGGPNGVEELSEAGYLEPLYDLPEDYPPDNPDSLLYANGKVYGKATLRMMLGLAYRKDLFAEYGLSVPECWEDLLDCCEVLLENGIQPLITGGKDPTVFQYGLYQIAANRLYPSCPDYDEQLRKGKACFTDPGTWDDILDQYLSLFRAGYLGNNYLRLKSDEALDCFKSGEAAMIITTSLYYSSILDGEDAEKTFGFIPLPANRRGEQLCISEGLIGGFGVYAGSGQKESLVQVLTDFYEHDLTCQDMGRHLFTEKAYWDLPVYYFCNQGWPNEVEVVMENKILEYLSGADMQVSDITAAMQAELIR